MDRFLRTQMLIGNVALEKLKKSRIIIFGVGGVGSYVAEALARSGVGNIALVDNDTVAKSNINRQLIALTSTLSRPKVEVMRERILDINPCCKVNAYQCFYTAEKEVDIKGYDYVIDAIDTVTSKLILIEEATKHSIPIISSMGTGNKLDATRFEITDIYKTSVCPLAKVMRRELKKREIKKLKVLYSKEEPITPCMQDENSEKQRTPASISFVPSVAGLIIAGEVIKDLINKKSVI